jgi:ribonuclease HI
MGFRLFRDFNEALLAKQGWRIITQPQSLVAQVLKAKYFPQNQFLEAQPKHNMSYSWKSILQASWILKKGCYWSVGNGENINVWKDNWIQQKGNSHTWSTIAPNTEHLKVKDLMLDNYNEWNAILINQLFLPFEAQKILNIPIIDKTQNDTLTWDGTTDGNYTVKDGYQAISKWKENANIDSASTSGHDNELWEKIWKLKVPPKHIHLIWRILHDALPVKTKLFQKGIRCDTLCPKCNNNYETIYHVFLECDWVKQIWFMSPLTINLTNNQFTNFFDWFVYMLNHTSQDCMEQIAAIIYGIWYSRNQKVFQGKDLLAENICNTALNHLTEFQRLNLHVNTFSRAPVAMSSSHNNSWSPPPRGTLKINVDAHLSSDGHWFSGLLLRRSDGSTVGAATRAHFELENANFGEALGLNATLDMVGKLQEHSIIFELDSQVIVKAVSSPDLIRKPWGFITRRCKSFLIANPNSSICWVSRAKNQAAHFLARWAEAEPNKEWVNSYPDCINPYIQKDINSMYFSS